VGQQKVSSQHEEIPDLAAIIKKCDCAEQRRCKHAWTVRYRAGGRQRERSFRHDQKSVANEFALKVEHDKKAGVFIDPKLGDMSLGDWCDRWIRQHQGAHNSREAYEGVLANHIRPAIGDMAIRRVTREHVQDLLLETMPNNVGRAMVVSARTLLSAAFSEAVRAGRIQANPAAGIRLPAAQEAAEFIMPNREQLNALTDGMARDWALCVWIMRGCGLRFGEVLAVSESSVRDHVLRVGGQMYDRPPRIGPLKHRKPGEYRDVPLPDYVAKRIKDHVAAHGMTSSGHLFRGRRHELPSQNTVRESFTAGAKKAGLPPQFTPHDLRHVFASVALSNGIPVTDVSRWLGHRSVDTTFRIYSHFVPDAFERGRDVLDADFNRLG
jgi:integrase